MTLLRTILVLRFSSIGDIVQTTSLVSTLMKYFPELKIDFMTLSKFAPLLEGHPHINKVHAVDINAGYKKLRQIGFEIEMMGYDLAIDLHNTTRSQVIRRGLINTKNVHIKNHVGNVSNYLHFTKMIFRKIFQSDHGSMNQLIIFYRIIFPLMTPIYLFQRLKKVVPGNLYINMT